MPDRTTPIAEPLHIVVVDESDHESDRSRTLLEAAGYRVSTVDLPDIGLVRREEPDAIVLGLIYRGQASGLAFLERHISDPITASVPVVVHASEDELSAEEWTRLITLAHSVLPMAQSADRLLSELQRVLVVTAAA
jgi:CheY-like chemotaxis protein